MKPQLLVPDLSATEDIDLVLLQLEHGLSVARSLAETMEDEGDRARYQAEADEAEAMIAAYQRDESMPVVVVGYIPARKKSTLHHQALAAYQARGKGDKQTADDMDLDSEIARQWVQWGVKGHRGFVGFDFETQDVELGGKTYHIASDDCVELYEQMGLLHLIAREVVDFNTLSTKKKTRSQPGSGAETATLTAPDVTVTTTGSE